MEMYADLTHGECKTPKSRYATIEDTYVTLEAASEKLDVAARNAMSLSILPEYRELADKIIEAAGVVNKLNEKMFAVWRKER